MFKNVIFASAFVLCLGKEIPFIDCGSKEATIKSLDVTPCEQAGTRDDPCHIRHNQTYNAIVPITITKGFRSAHTKLYGIIGGAKIPFPLPGGSDACACSMKCPEPAGATANYTASLYCDPVYPKLKLVAEWHVEDDDTKDDILCFAIPLVITD